MIEATYSVLRYVPDAMRNEPVNVGVVIWSDDIHEVLVNLEVMGRILSANPTLDQTAFDGFLDFVREQLLPDPEINLDTLEDRLRRNLQFPLQATSPIFTSIDLEAQDANHLRSLLIDEAGSLSELLVRPRKRASSSRRTSPQRALVRQLRPYITANRVYENFGIKGERSGDMRRVAFYANSGANVALDIVHSPGGRIGEQSAIRTSDAVAFELSDIMSADTVNAVMGYLPVDFRPELQEIRVPLEARLSNLGIRLAFSAEDAVTEFKVLGGFDTPLAAD